MGRTVRSEFAEVRGGSGAEASGSVDGEFVAIFLEMSEEQSAALKSNSNVFWLTKQMCYDEFNLSTLEFSSVV